MDCLKPKKLKAGERLESTMPVGEAEAVVLVFCSIDCPFPVPGQQSMEQTAFALAERFCSIFAAETKRLHLRTPIYCGIGLAKGKVEGIFQRSGQKQYHLRGARDDEKAERAWFRFFDNKESL